LIQTSSISRSFACQQTILDALQDETHAFARCGVTEINTVGQNTSINRINQKLQMFTDWTATGIEKRQELLISLAGEVWKTTQLVQESSVAVT
jgi:hypothetical protein